MQLYSHVFGLVTKISVISKSLHYGIRKNGNLVPMNWLRRHQNHWSGHAVVVGASVSASSPPLLLLLLLSSVWWNVPRARPWNGSLLIETGAECMHRCQIVTHNLIRLPCNNVGLFLRASNILTVTDASSIVHFHSRVFSRPGYA